MIHEPDMPERFPQEGETITIKKTRVRRCCDECGEPAFYKHTYLLEGDRRNPASSAYGRDDCSRCEDERIFTCKECGNYHKHPPAPEGYRWCGTWPATANHANIFLTWEEEKL